VTCVKFIFIDIKNPRDVSQPGKVLSKTKIRNQLIQSFFQKAVFQAVFYIPFTLKEL
jgi:hypothetical protein